MGFFFFIFFNSFLLVNKKADICILILYHATLLNSFISSSSHKVSAFVIFEEKIRDFSKCELYFTFHQQSIRCPFLPYTLYFFKFF